MSMLGSQHLSQQGWFKSTKAEWVTLVLRLRNPVPMRKFLVLELESSTLESWSIKARLGLALGFGLASMDLVLGS